jgi:hypothetical protein
LANNLLGEPDDAIADGSGRLPQGGPPQQPGPTPAGEWHDRPPLRHATIVATEASRVNPNRAIYAQHRHFTEATRQVMLGA